MQKNSSHNKIRNQISVQPLYCILHLLNPPLHSLHNPPLRLLLPHKHQKVRRGRVITIQMLKDLFGIRDRSDIFIIVLAPSLLLEVVDVDPVVAKGDRP